MAEIERERITGAILAGGEGRRMGGVDKGLVEVDGRPLVAWTLDALRDQVGALLINANRSQAQYQRFGVPVVSDAGSGYQGPLAGKLAALAAAQTDYVLTVPCDAPLIAPRLAPRLADALVIADAEIAVAWAEGRRQSVHALMRRNLQRELARALAGGTRKIGRWQNTRRCVEVSCDDIAATFINVNTPEERERLAQTLASRRSAS